MDKKATYREAGVDIDEATRMVEMIKPMVKATYRPEVSTDIGGFGALFRPDLSRYKRPVLVSGTDGVGTKLKVAFWANRHDTIGIDLVAMSVNDLVVQGAEPLFFLDYYACGKLKAEDAAQVVKGIAEGCRQAGCALIGGETAELPGFYKTGEYDLAGFSVGIVDEDDIVDGRRVTPGDVVLGMPSNGLHSNGYSLARKILFDNLGLSPESEIRELGGTVADVLLNPTKIYVKPILDMVRTGKVKALAHITGGGFFDNIPRVLPDRTYAVIERAAVPVLPIFSFLMTHGPVEEREMYRTFNMGIGMVAVVAEADVEPLQALAAQHGEELVRIGRIHESDEAPHVIIE